MKRRTDRILTTHVGSLPRPPDLLDMMKGNLTGEGEPVDATVYNQKLTDTVAACARRTSIGVYWHPHKQKERTDDRSLSR